MAGNIPEPGIEKALRYRNAPVLRGIFCLFVRYVNLNWKLINGWKKNVKIRINKTDEECNADTEYTGWKWWLARSDGGEWKLMTWGY